MGEPAKWPLGLKSIREIGLPLVHLGKKEFVERYPPPDRLKLVASNRGSRALHVKTETGLRVDLPPAHKLMLDSETGTFSIWTMSEGEQDGNIV